MGQVNKKLRRGTDFYSHYCPGCEGMHNIHDSWVFNGNVDCPTFTPSVSVGGMTACMSNSGFKIVGKFVGAREKGKCHYFLTNGQLQFLSDCTHRLAGKTVPLPDLPPIYCDRKA